ncbi:hypothetical protein ACFXPN_05240 [Streptomyces griseorubiginosus]|uniref:hypothetical protein n=1 Tax=Streptomyces griseorubiginosus TaxID=67304 RepID=UPI00369B05DB
MMRERLQTQDRRRVLRRRSWPVLSWSGIGFLWALYLLALLSFLAHENYRDALLVAAVISAITALFHRIGSCRIVLLDDAILVENPIMAYLVPYRDVRGVHTASGGGLEIETHREGSVRPFAFGGSLVDAFFKTSQRAAAEIQVDFARKRNPTDSGAEEKTTRSIRSCRFADSLLVLALLLAVGAVSFT